MSDLDNENNLNEEEKTLFQKIFPVVSAVLVFVILILASVLVYQSMVSKKQNTVTASATPTPTAATPTATPTATPALTATPTPAATTAPETTTPGADANTPSNFTAVNESVTAKDTVNLRSTPGQGDDSTVLAELTNGEVVTRTGISDNGWSEIEYNGQTCYAVSSYLTTDLNYENSSNTVEDSDGIKTVFTEISDVMTAKEEVNLRTLPSVTNADSTVVATIYNGDTITRTGINEEVGWSRVEYNGQTLYCITSYLTTP